MTPIKPDFKYDVFISYARKDGAEKAEALADALRAKGFSVYYDLYQNEPGIDWWQRIEGAITSAKSLLFIITEASVVSSVCRDEWDTAEKLNRPLLPVKVVDSTGNIIRDGDIPAHINRIHYIDTVKDWNAGIDEIAHFLTRYDYLYDLQSELNQLVSESTARRFIEIIATENAEAKKNLERRVRVRTLKRQATVAQEFNSFDEAWEHYQGQVLLLGAAGAGKTTTLLHYAQTLVSRYLGDRNQPVPVFASIAYWDSYKNQALYEWLPEHNELPEDIQKVIHNGQAVLILDGLDELGREKPINPKKPEEGTFDPRKRFLEQVQTAIDNGNQILITCRVTDYEEIGEKLNIKGAIELQNLRDEQIETYLGDVPTIQKTVMADSELMNICRSPLLLSLIAFGYRDATEDLKALPSMEEGDLRDAIFERYITASYDFEASRRELQGEEMPFTLEKVLDVLGHAAMINVCGGWRDDGKEYGYGSQIVENVLIRHDFTHHLEATQIDDFLIFMEQLNIIENHETDHYRFLHLLLRDYLTYTFSMRHLVEDTYYLRATYFVPALALGSVGDTRAVEALIHVLKHDENEDVRGCSAQALGEIGDMRAVEPLIYVLKHDKIPWIRECSAQALGKIGDARAVEAFTYALQHDENEDVRIVLAEALGEIGDTYAIEALIHALQHDENGDVRMILAEALGEIGDTYAIEPLIHILKHDDVEIVRQSSAEALGKIGDTYAIEALIHALKHDKDENVRRYSAQALGEIGDNHAVEAFIYALQHDENRYVHKSSVEALEKIGTPEALQAVKAWRESQESDKD